MATCVISATALDVPPLTVLPTRDETKIDTNQNIRLVRQEKVRQEKAREEKPKDESEAGLIRRAQNGDEHAFASLYQLNKKRVYSVCLQMTKDVADAEDLTQDAFLQVFRSIGSFRGDSAFSTWLYRIAVNTVLMKLRRRKSPPLVSLDEPVSADTPSLKRDIGKADPALSGVVDRIALRRAVEELPAGCRQIFDLHEVEGYQHHEIAQLLQCSIGNSKSQLHKAKMKMRDVLFPKRKTAPTSLEPTVDDEPSIPVWEASNPAALSQSNAAI